MSTTYVDNELNQYARVSTPGGATGIGQGYRYDEDGNLVEAYVAADMNCDAFINGYDVDAFVLALTNPAQYAAQYPGCNPLNGDINGDGLLNGYDVDGFVAYLSGHSGSTGLRFGCSWDAENRLTAVYPVSPQTGDKKVEFKYDYLGRRFEKDVYDWTGSAWSETASQVRRFVWAGWLMLMELDGDNQPVRKYTWGLDLAGQAGVQSSALPDALEGAGGIGGLLAVQDTNGTPGDPNDDLKYAYTYDGNGNVVQVLDWAAASAVAAIVAKYEYDPYGNVVASGGDYAAANPFRFSTKYWDDETGLLYFGERYYSPKMGRWTSWDPAGEDAGANLYGFVYNDPSNDADPLGLSGFDPFDPGGARLPPKGPDWGTGNGAFEAKCGSVNLATAQRLAEEAWNRYQYHASRNKPEDKKAAAYWYSVYRRWAGCIFGKGSKISVCFRRMRSDGQDCKGTCQIAIANAAGLVYEGATHAYLATNPCCLEEGYGLTGGEKKGQPPSQEHSGFACPFRCQTCYRQNRILQHGSGRGKQGLFASDGEILDCIQNAKAKEDWSAASYNCQDWAFGTAHECGLVCPG